MVETYTIKIAGLKPEFEKTDQGLPKELMNARFSPELPQLNLEFVCRMGDPDLVHCIVYRNMEKPGGVFCVHDKNGLLFAAFAESNLAFFLGEGFFGEVTSNAVYGIDVFENREEPDD